MMNMKNWKNEKNKLHTKFIDVYYKDIYFEVERRAKLEIIVFRQDYREIEFVRFFHNYAFSYRNLTFHIESPWVCSLLGAALKFQFAKVFYKDIQIVPYVPRKHKILDPIPGVVFVPIIDMKSRCYSFEPELARCRGITLVSALIEDTDEDSSYEDFGYNPILTKYSLLYKLIDDIEANELLSKDYHYLNGLIFPRPKVISEIDF